MFTAQISKMDHAGEASFSAVVLFQGRAVFKWEGPSQNYVQCEVLDWARRHGKADQLNWEYKTMNTARTETLGNFLSKGLAAQQAVDKVIRLHETQGALNRQESEQLFDLEKVIETGLDTFVQVGQALAKIRDERLYRYRYTNFEDYVRERWGMSARHAHRLVDGAEIATNLLPPALASTAEEEPAVTNWSAPTNESQLRPLKGLEPGAQRQVWEEANKSAGAAPVTARHVDEAKEKLHPSDKWPRPNAHGVYEKEGENLRYSRNGCHATIHLLQIRQNGWVGATSFDFKQAAGINPITADWVCKSRESALEHFRTGLMQSINSILKTTTTLSQKNRFEANAALLWLDGLRDTFTLEVESEPRPETSLEKLQLRANQLILDAEALGKELPHDELSIKQRLHLGIAVTHLKNFRGSLDQALDPHRKMEEAAQRGNTLAGKSAAKARANAVAKWEKQVSDKFRQPHVICRTSLAGVRTFDTGKGGGWSNNPAKAKRFQNAATAKAACRHSYDKPMKLSTAEKSAR